MELCRVAHLDPREFGPSQKVLDVSYLHVKIRDQKGRGAERARQSSAEARQVGSTRPAAISTYIGPSITLNVLLYWRLVQTLLGSGRIHSLL